MTRDELIALTKRIEAKVAKNRPSCRPITDADRKRFDDLKAQYKEALE